MGLESCIICIDNSDYMRNGDFIPSRMQCQFDAVNMVALAKTKSNPENNVGLLSLADTRVLVTLTTEIGKLISKLHAAKPSGNIDLVRGIKVANLALKHRQSKNHKPRIILFIASPVTSDQLPELIKLGKRLKKEKVNIDIINFGEEDSNSNILNELINTINGKEGTGSHLVSIAAPANLSDALFSSSIFQSEDGSGTSLPAGFGPGYQYGMEDDPELAMALRISMEESRLAQESNAKKTTEGEMEMETNQPTTGEDDLMQQALSLSLGQTDSGQGQGQAKPPVAMSRDISSMTEEEQLNYALQMSMSHPDSETPSAASTNDKAIDDAEMKDEEDDYAKAMNDPEFLQRVISSLPGVDPNSEAIRSAVDDLTKDGKGQNDPSKKEDEKK
jgi:26S proteasome regulatory subunit N10